MVVIIDNVNSTLKSDLRIVKPSATRQSLEFLP